MALVVAWVPFLSRKDGPNESFGFQLQGAILVGRPSLVGWWGLQPNSKRNLIVVASDLRAMASNLVALCLDKDAPNWHPSWLVDCLGALKQRCRDELNRSCHHHHHHHHSLGSRMKHGRNLPGWFPSCGPTNALPPH